MLNISQPLAHITAYFILDGKKYEVEHFNTSFEQAADYKGQPQNEVHGGKLALTLNQAADDNLYTWAKKSTMLKSGQVLFQTDLGISVLCISFEDAYCIALKREVNSFTGTKTTLIIAPEIVLLNNTPHNNNWKKA